MHRNDPFQTHRTTLQSGNEDKSTRTDYFRPRYIPALPIECQQAPIAAFAKHETTSQSLRGSPNGIKVASGRYRDIGGLWCCTSKRWLRAARHRTTIRGCKGKRKPSTIRNLCPQQRERTGLCEYRQFRLVEEKFLRVLA